MKNIQVKFADKREIVINWYYEEDDEGLQEAGEVFQSLLNIPFNLIPIE